MSVPDSQLTDRDFDLQPILALAADALQTVPRDPGDLFKQLRQVSEMLGNLATAPTQPALVFRRGDRMEAREIGDALTVGRASACDLCFPEFAEMSRRQFTINARGAHYALTDGGSFNGTFIRGVRGRIDTRELRDGDIIESGGVTFAFIRPAKDSRAASAPG